MRTPNFFLVGAPKSGTTALYRYLRAHPEVWMPQIKEPHYFAPDLVSSKFIGDRDEYLLHLGARRFVRSLRDHGIAHDYEEFPGGHRGTAWRYQVSLPRLAQVLTAK